MKGPFIIFHPLVVFILSIVAVGLSIFFYLHWYFSLSTNVGHFTEQFHIDPASIMTTHSLAIIVTISLLMGSILLGLALIFIYYQKTIKLYHLQENFINNFTHELKTPLASIKLYLETFLKYSLTRDKQIEFINYMLKDTKRLSDHVQQILHIGIIENKNHQAEFEQVDLVKFVHDFIKNNSHHFQNGEININHHSIEFEDSPLIVSIHPPLFEILLMNLTTNAFKYNLHDHPKLEITFTLLKNSILIEFTDNGIGIMISDLKKIFKKFYQGKQSFHPLKGGSKLPFMNESSSKLQTTPPRLAIRSSGTGLGLYITKQIVKIHHGKIFVISKGTGYGSTFKIILPLDQCKKSSSRYLQSLFKFKRSINEYSK